MPVTYPSFLAGQSSHVLHHASMSSTDPQKLSLGAARDSPGSIPTRRRSLNSTLPLVEPILLSAGPGFHNNLSSLSLDDEAGLRLAPHALSNAEAIEVLHYFRALAIFDQSA
jgi:hypothetical protein